MSHASRADSVQIGDGEGSLQLDYFTDTGSRFVAVFTVFADHFATVYVVFPPAEVIAKARTKASREKCLVRWIVENVHRASSVRTFELADGRAVGSS